MAPTQAHDHPARFPAVLLLIFAICLLGCEEKAPGPTAAGTGKPATTGAAPTGAAPTAAPTGAKPADTPSIKQPPPAVANAAEAKKLAGAKITFYGDAVGLGAELDKVMAKKFTDETGIEVKVIQRSNDATESYAAYQRLFQAQSADVDVVMLDVIWPGAFGQHLADLGPKLGEAAKAHFENIVKNNTIDGKLVAIPWYTDFGMLYYRSDLLKKHGFDKAPETWDDLEKMAKKIVDAEKGANPTFTGFVWQGKSYEGLTCNALEWIYSHGGGMIIEDGKTTLNNPQAAKALGRAKGWIGTISPAGVTGYQEEEARNAFQGGNAVFMRNWPYAYGLGNSDTSPIKGKFDVAPLPHEAGQKSAGTVGGWQIGVSKYSKAQDASIELVRYLTSPEAQKYRAIVGSLIPTIKTVQADPEVTKALPFLAKLPEVTLVTRPSNATGARYNEASSAFFQGVSQALQGTDPATVVKQVEERLKRVLR